MKKSLCLPIGLFLSCLVSIASANLATDNAADVVYDDGWTAGDNGGNGLLQWDFEAAVGASDATIASSAGNGGATTIDTSGESWRLIDSGLSGSFIGVYRTFINDLQVGETFSIDMDVNFRATGFKGIRVRDTDDATEIFKFETASDDYLYDDDGTGGSGSTSIGTGYSADTVFNIAMEQTSAGGGTWTITRSGGIADLDTGSYSGMPSSIQLYTFQAQDNAEDAIYFNNLQIIPEPSSAFLLVLGLGVLARTAGRRK